MISQDLDQKEHQQPAGTGSMHTDLGVDIEHPGRTHGEKGAQQEIHEIIRDIAEITEHVPDPEIKNDRGSIRYDPLLLRT